MPDKGGIENALENGLFASRWLIAPMYLGLVVALAMLVVIFVRELIDYIPQVISMSADKAILAVLTLIDLTLAANLLLIVIFSGYENFVSKLDVADNTDRPAWMGTVDFSGLKMKLIASIVAISGIHLLKVFMEIGKGGEYAMSQDNLFWMATIHVVFVVSGLMMAAMDWLVGNTSKHGKKGD
jgi:uncharacterized protein (TIGR00645 family)